MGAFVRSKFRLFHFLVCVFCLSAVLQAQDGGLDFQFAPVLDGAVHAMAIQSDGKIVIAGDFTTVNGVPRGRVARVNSDGSLDTAFGANLSGANGSVRCLALWGTKIYVGGDFTSINGTARSRIARLNADGTVETAFNPGTGANSTVYAVAVDPSSFSLLIGGDFTTVNGTARNRLAQLSTGGSLNSSSFAGSGANGTVYAITPDPSSGEVYVGGAFTNINGTARNRIALFRYSGFNLSLDTQFNSTLTSGPDGSVYCISTVQYPSTTSAGRLVIGGDFAAVGGTPCGKLALIDAASGIAVQSFSVSADAPVRSAFFDAKTSGASAVTYKVQVGGDFDSINGVPCHRVGQIIYDQPRPPQLPRVTVDSSYGTGTGANGSVECMAPETDGKVLIGGLFTSFDEKSRSYFARLYGPGGAAPPERPAAPIVGTGTETQLILVWSSGLYTSGYRFERSTDGIGGWTQINPATLGSPAYPYTDKGLAPDTPYFYRVIAYSTNGDSEPSPVVSARTLAAPWLSAGAPDTNFITRIGSGASSVDAISVQPDGKILLGGSFSTFNGVATKALIRLNSDGTPDSTFSFGVSNVWSVPAIAFSAGGKIIVGCGFSSAPFESGYGVVRLNSDGSIDSSFSRALADSPVKAVAIQPDGKIVAAGSFRTVGGQAHAGIARLNVDGSIDSSFNAGISFQQGYSLAVQPDGKILVAGFFQTVNGTPRGNIARLNTDGSLDTTFAQGTGANSWVESLTLQSDGRIVITGPFSRYDNVPRNCVARLLANGSIDPSFAPPSGSMRGWVNSAAVQDDGKIIIGGWFITVDSSVRLRIARLNADGTLDSGFLPGLGTDTDVGVLALGPDGKCVAGGLFTSVNGTSSPGVTRFLADNGAAAPGTPSSFSAVTLSSHSVRLSWSVVPFSSGYKVMQSPNGTSNWVEIGSPAVGTASFTVDSLPSGTPIYFRLRPYSTNGDATEWVTASATTYSPYQQWKLDNGLTLQVADDGDPDGDGVPNLMEYALGSAPNLPSLNAMPTASVTRASLTLSYSKLRPELTYTVETSSDLNSWTAQGVDQGGSGPSVTASTPLDGTASKFLRLRVTRP